MTVAERGQSSFLHGVRPTALVIGAIGGCLFVIAFFVKTEEGIGRAIGLLGLGIILFAMTFNLLLQVMSERAGSKHRRHLMTQAVFASLVAAAVFALAAYVFRYGTLPNFMPMRYHDKYHFRQFGDVRPPGIIRQTNLNS